MERVSICRLELLKLQGGLRVIQNLLISCDAFPGFIRNIKGGDVFHGAGSRAGGIGEG